jgi:hypothetical protein
VFVGVTASAQDRSGSVQICNQRPAPKARIFASLS